ncbi:MAG: glycosyltransferase family 2 protein [Planctomycetota bacterium]
MPAEPPSPNDAPLVTVGIPTYNRPEGLRRTLAHIVGQTYRNLDIVVSDNCSPGEATAQVVEEFRRQDPRIRYFRQPENQGAAFNFTFVMEQARARYFIWAADDDWFESDDLIARLAALVQAPGGLLAFPDVNIVHDDRGPVRVRRMQAVFGRCRTDYEYLVAWCHYGAGYPVYGLYDRERMADGGLAFAFEPDLAYFNEGLFLHRIFLAGGARFAGDVSYNFSRSRAGVLARLGPAEVRRSFRAYAGRVLRFYWRSRLPWPRKIRILNILFWKYLRYYLKLLRRRAPAAPD